MLRKYSYIQLINKDSKNKNHSNNYLHQYLMNVKQNGWWIEQNYFITDKVLKIMFILSYL